MEIKIKFKPGDKGWAMYQNAPTELEIYKVSVYSSLDDNGDVVVYIDYSIKIDGKYSIYSFNDDSMFKTKEELLESL